jgi:hypothetical protein
MSCFSSVTVHDLSDPDGPSRFSLGPLATSDRGAYVLVPEQRPEAIAGYAQITVVDPDKGEVTHRGRREPFLRPIALALPDQTMTATARRRSPDPRPR